MRRLLVLLGVTALWVSLLALPSQATEQPQPSSVAPSSKSVPRPSFKIASFNTLGASHTDRGGSRAGMASGVTRTKWMIKLMNRYNIKVAGLQEFQKPQMYYFKKRASNRFGLFPGKKAKQRNTHNAVIWRKDTFKLVKPSTVKIPYFNGRMLDMPVVRLRERASGREIFVVSVHNPATTRQHGNQLRWREKAMRIEIQLTKRLLKRHRIPVFMTGDMNERERYFCQYTKNGRMIAAAGGSNRKVCKPPPGRIARVDWVFGPRGTKFTNYRFIKNRAVQRTSDHPLIVARAKLPARLRGK